MRTESTDWSWEWPVSGLVWSRLSVRILRTEARFPGGLASDRVLRKWREQQGERASPSHLTPAQLTFGGW